MSGIPPYLTSGASSRAHHAFLAKLHRAQSASPTDASSSATGVGSSGGASGVGDHGMGDEDVVVLEEVERCLKVLVQRGTSHVSLQLCIDVYGRVTHVHME
jgi:hypothetical protein